MIDYTKLRKKLDPEPQIGGDPGLRLRAGVVTAMNTVNGTATISMIGATISDVPVLNGSSLAVNAVVQVLSHRGGLLILGPVGYLGQSTGLGVITGDTAVADSAAIGVETIINTVPSTTYYVGRVYRVTVLGHVQVSVGPNRAALRIHKTNVAGTEITSSETDARLAATDYEAGFEAVFKILGSNVTASLVLTLQSIGAFTTVHRCKKTRGVIVQDIGLASNPAFSGTFQLT